MQIMSKIAIIHKIVTIREKRALDAEMSIVKKRELGARPRIKSVSHEGLVTL